jgi:hypothetical protein
MAGKAFVLYFSLTIVNYYKLNNKTKANLLRIMPPRNRHTLVLSIKSQAIHSPCLQDVDTNNQLPGEVLRLFRDLSDTVRLPGPPLPLFRAMLCRTVPLILSSATLFFISLNRSNCLLNSLLFSFRYTRSSVSCHMVPLSWWAFL